MKGQSDPLEMSGSHNTRLERHLYMVEELLVGIIFLICISPQFTLVFGTDLVLFSFNVAVQGPQSDTTLTA